MKRFSIILALLLIGSLLLVSCTGKKEEKQTAAELVQTQGVQSAPTSGSETTNNTDSAETTENTSVTPITPPGDISGGGSQPGSSENQNQSGAQENGQSGNQSGSQGNSQNTNQGGSQTGNQSGNQGGGQTATPETPDVTAPTTSSMPSFPNGVPESEIILRN